LEAVAAGCWLIPVDAWSPLIPWAIGIPFARKSGSGFPAWLKESGLNGVCTTDASTAAPESLLAGNGSGVDGDGDGAFEATGAGVSVGNAGWSEFFFSSGIGPRSSEPVALGGAWAE
jgi:hypothetical protein